MRRALVTGCAGFIGSHLTEKLLSHGWTVAGVDSFAPTYETEPRRRVVGEISQSPHFRFTEGDIGQMELGGLVEDADVVFHLAARPGVRASWGDFNSSVQANIFALQRVLDALRNQPSVPLVFASSSSVYGKPNRYPTKESSQLRPISPYGVTKATGEALVGAYASQFGIRAVMLRYFTVYGPRQRSDMAFHRWISAAMEGRPLPLYGDGTAVRDFTYVADVVDATMAAAEVVDGCQAFNVAGGSPASIQEVLALISELLSTRFEIEQQPRAKGDPDRTGGDTSRISAEYGWRPNTALRDGIAAQIEWMRSHPRE